MPAHPRRNNRGLIVVISLVAVVLVGLTVRAVRVPSDGPLLGQAVMVYRSATCGCCKNYVSYLRRQGAEVQEEVTEDMAGIKQKFGVPNDLSSCHTTRLGAYTIEGHIPVEVIEKLLQEQPDIAGIALPGMPSGSPGMPGAKFDAFAVSSFTAAGETASYMNF